MGVSRELRIASRLLLTEASKIGPINDQLRRFHLYYGSLTYSGRGKSVSLVVTLLSPPGSQGRAPISGSHRWLWFISVSQNKVNGHKYVREICEKGGQV